MTLQTLMRTAPACVCLGLSMPVLAQSDNACVVARIEGAPVALADGGPAQPLTPGGTVAPGTRVRTGDNDRVTLACAEGLTVVVGPATEIAPVGVLEGGTRPFALRLLDGIAGFLKDAGGAGGVQVNTPSAVAAVRSTEWAMRVADGASAVFTREGSVFVFGTGDANTRLRPGEGIDVTPDGTLGPLVEWGQARIDRFGTLLGPDW